MLADAAPNQIQVHRLMVSAEDGIKCRLSGTCLLHNHQFPIHPELLHLTDPLLPDSKGPRTVEPVSTQLFADESKRRGFVMAAVEADSASVAHHRKALRQQLLRGQERLHFTGESKQGKDCDTTHRNAAPPRPQRPIVGATPETDTISERAPVSSVTATAIS